MKKANSKAFRIPPILPALALVLFWSNLVDPFIVQPIIDYFAQFLPQGFAKVFQNLVPTIIVYEVLARGIILYLTLKDPEFYEPTHEQIDRLHTKEFAPIASQLEALDFSREFDFTISATAGCAAVFVNREKQTFAEVFQAEKNINCVFSSIAREGTELCSIRAGGKGSRFTHVIHEEIFYTPFPWFRVYLNDNSIQSVFADHCKWKETLFTENQLTSVEMDNNQIYLDNQLARRRRDRYHFNKKSVTYIALRWIAGIVYFRPNKSKHIIHLNDRSKAVNETKKTA